MATAVYKRLVAAAALTCAASTTINSTAVAGYNQGKGVGEFILNESTGAVTACSFQWSGSAGQSIGQCAKIGAVTPAAPGILEINVVLGGMAFIVNKATGQIWLCSYGSYAGTGVVTGACVAKGTALN